MKLGMSQITTLSTEGIADLEPIAAAGFTGVELSLDKVGAYLKSAPIAALRDTLHALGLRPTGAIGLAPQGPALLLARDDAWQAYLASLEEQLAICSELGVETIGIGADAARWAPREPWQAGAVGNIRQAAELAERHGIRIGLEFMSLAAPVGPFILDSLTATRALVADVAHPSVGINIDFFHHYRSGGTAEELSTLSGDEITAIHVTDVASGSPEDLGDGDRVLPGEGVLDLRGYRNAIEATGYDGYWTLELLNEALWAAPPREAAQRGFEAMTRFAGMPVRQPERRVAHE